MNRRSFLKVTGGAAVLPFAMSGFRLERASAQAANALAGLGLPELTITLTDTGYEVAPASTPAGWTLITFVNKQSFGDNAADIMALPAGQTVDSVTNTMATAVAGGPVPDWAFQATFVGSPWAPAGKSAQGVGLLTAGDWMVFNGGAPIPPAALTVAEASPSAATPPALAADVEVGLTEYSFTGLDKALAVGAQVWKVSNIGAQPHLMHLDAVPAGTTADQLMNTWMGLFSGTPVAGALPPDQLQNVGGCGTLSRGESIYLALELPAGTYGAVCFFPDEGDGMPHLMKGMVAVLTVA